VGSRRRQKRNGPKSQRKGRRKKGSAKRRAMRLKRMKT